MSLFKKTKPNSAVLAYLKTYDNHNNTNNIEHESIWQPTKAIGKYIAFNDHLQQFKVFKNSVDTTGTIYKYSDLVSYHLLENENLITRSSYTSPSESETYVTSLKIKITVRNTVQATIWIELINGKLSRSCNTYKQLSNIAHEIISTLEIIYESNKTTSYVSKEFCAADEIRKYKLLFDDGIISENEFELKKKQLLNL